MPKLRKQDVVDQVKALGLRAKWQAEWNEWKVNYPGGEEATAYYTSDGQDAIDTARRMAKEGKP